MAKRRGFKAGKGISALLNSIDTEIETNKAGVVKELAANFAMLPIEEVNPNPNQPRKHFEAEALQELSESIKSLGVIQPITVKHLAHKKYEIISGERRYRASKVAGLTKIPAYIRIGNDQELMEMALVENIQRKDLNAIEIANTYSRLIAEFSLTHEQLSDRVGKKRSAITNYLRLLKLDPKIQADVKNGHLSMGHARALAGIQDLAILNMVHQKVLDEALSVRQTEALVAQYSSQPKARSAAKPRLSPEFQRVQDNLTNMFSTKVNVKVNPKGKGQIVINFMNNNDLNRILEMLDE